MHLLSAKPGGYNDDEGIIDLQQTPGDIIILASQDNLLASLAHLANTLPEDYPSIRLANLLHLTKPAAFDLYTHKVLSQSKMIIVSLLGGKAYWPYGVEQLEILAKQYQIPVAILPGDDQPAPELLHYGTIEQQDQWQLWRYLREGGTRNIQHFFYFIGQRFFDRNDTFEPPKQLPATIVYHPIHKETTLPQWQSQWHADQPVVALIFYRSHFQSSNTQAFDEFIHILTEHGMNPLPIAVLSIKNTACMAMINHLCEVAQVSLILNTTGFSAASYCSEEGYVTNRNHSFSINRPVLQVILSSSSKEDWQDQYQGLRARDIAMHVALPEIDGRIISRAISFKTAITQNTLTQSDIIHYQLEHDRGHFVAQLAKNWTQLQTLANEKKCIALVLANYPTKDGRIGNGVGLDTPQSVINILRALQSQHYPVSDIPEHGNELIQRLLAYVTNDTDQLNLRHCSQSLTLEQYHEYFSQLPQTNQAAVLARWGAPENDPKVRQNRLMVAGIRLGLTFVGIQPARGYNLDVSATYHDPDLVPPHSYLAFYFWMRHVYQANAVIHVGKHGNLEWLPGKSIALSSQCWPEVALGPLPHFYPFIVNDPGEGSQAKRRAQAVIIDHLTPAMTRAESYGDMLTLEHLLDEYYQALDLDKRRANHVKQQILQLSSQSHLIQELPFDQTSGESTLLNNLDNYLCELKEAQIRDGLHILGEAPKDQQRIDTLIALTRFPRGQRLPEEQSILNALCMDLGLANDFNPIHFDAAKPWADTKPNCLQSLTPQTWRTAGDTRERLELYAQQLVKETLLQPTVVKDTFANLPATQQVLAYIASDISPKLDQSGNDEIENLIKGLANQFVPAGPSGAPSRGRLDVLPTGRNFYSVDTRAIPTPAAWQLGKISAEQVVQRYMQEHGDYPRNIGLSVWGTSTMRTGGDDIAQAFALMGIEPVWATGSNRVIDFKILPAFILGRPRVDVMLRISGFFRDAFPNIIRLYNSAVKALAELEEPGDTNSIRQHVLDDIENYQQQGLDQASSFKQAHWRVFGSKPGAYGAGLQGLIDERCWQDKTDLATAYLNWGGYAYDLENTNPQAIDTFKHRLSNLEIVLQNQDNREHDILDSDDYYQFQGGMSNAVTVLSGQQPSIYHGDHSNPSAPKIRTLKEELNRVIRSRVTNPKWIDSIKRHGYKGAFEMAATVDYVYAYDATTDLIDDYQYGLITDNYLLDEATRDFLMQNNPNALKEMAERLLEAIQRGLWQQPGEYQAQLENILLSTEQMLEGIN